MTSSARCALLSSSARSPARPDPTRSRREDLFTACGSSAIETCRRQERDVFECLQQTVTTWLHNVPAPGLVSPAVPSETLEAQQFGRVCVSLARQQFLGGLADLFGRGGRA